MADVGKIEGGKLGPGPEGPKRKKGSEPDRFREMMKSGKVRETDPEEQRKRKSQAEREEEEAAEMTTAQPSNRDIITPTPSAEFDFKIPDTGGVAPAEEASAAPAPQSEPSFYEPPPEENYPVAETEPSVSTPQQPRAERRKPAEQQQQPVKKVTPTEKGKPAEKKAATTVKAQATKKEPPKGPEKPPAPSALKKAEEPTPTEEAAIPPPLTALPQGAWEATEDLERGEEKLVKKVAPVKKEEPVIPTTFQTPAPPGAPLVLPGEPLQPLAAPFAHLPAAVAALFERMVGVMTVMTTTGVTQTTINLDNPKYANSVFYGAQIVISEFSTAPKAYNIQLLGNQQAVTLFSNNVQELVAAFQAGNYTFKVNRIDTGYLAAPQERKKEVRRVKRKRGAE
ncbi:MAG: hypothetical protein JSS30_06420 [Verrucomicrobia bacterium]|nr:hypothetical protein [Verrucomicrobiota bacterium]